MVFPYHFACSAGFADSVSWAFVLYFIDSHAFPMSSQKDKVTLWDHFNKDKGVIFEASTCIT